MDEFIKLLDKDLKYLNHEIIDDTIYIYIASTRSEVPCPFCGQISTKTHSTYERSFQDLPIQGKKVKMIIKNRKMFCNNQECSHTTFAERFVWLDNKSKKTQRLKDEIVHMSLNCSSTAAARFLKENTVAVGKSSICNLLKKRKLLINKDEVSAVCIDDFALKKREKYGTVMVDINTHKIIDMLESREQDEVTEWLKSYPNIKVISRDGSITYHNSISMALSGAIQISDRFHLYKNLTDYAIEYLKKHLKKNVEVIIGSTDIEVPTLNEISKANENRKLTLEEKYNRILLLQMQNKNQTEICHEVNMGVRCYKKLMSASEAERIEMFSTTAATRHENNVLNKMKIVNEVRTLKCKGLNKSGISREMGLDFHTVTKYLDENFDPVHASYGIKKAGILSPFYKDIDSLLNQGFMGSKVEGIIRRKGYKGSSSTIRHYASRWKKRFKSNIEESKVEQGKEKIIMKRNDIFKTLFRPVSDIKNMEENKFLCFCKQYPLFNTILGLVSLFKDIFIQNKPELLNKWIAKARITGIEELISFTNGIERDYEAVVNAICLPYSNGLAEGSVNKIKVIKRVMYGRCSFKTLKSKTIQLEKIRKIN